MDPFPLVDRELELVPPHEQWADDLLAACRHPLTIRHAPGEARVTRDAIRREIAAHPLGRQLADPAVGKVPSYSFWMRLRHGPAGPVDRPPVRIAGGIKLLIGTNDTIERVYGHVGCHVYPPAQGHGYAERSCRLLLPLARGHGLRTLWITCNPDNFPSRRTCERLGAAFVDVVPVPPTDPLYARGETQKCRYRLDL